jgi:hypothetical protein
MLKQKDFKEEESSKDINKRSEIKPMSPRRTRITFYVKPKGSSRKKKVSFLIGKSYKRK